MTLEHPKNIKIVKNKLSRAVSIALFPLLMGSSLAVHSQEDLTEQEESVSVANAQAKKAAEAAENANEDGIRITEDGTEIIEVSGFRSSATSQLNNKRFSKNISDSIFAEDMGKMPDSNIAEAMSRISGIGIDRVDGEGTEITIRGVEASFNNIQMNGVTMTNSGDENSVDFSSMSADMLRSIEVIKSPSANHDEGSLGATVRLNTWKPLDIKERKTVINFKGVYNDLSEEINPTLGISFGNNFSDSFGMTASLNYSKNKTRQDKLTNWRWTFRDAGNPTSAQTGEALGENYWLRNDPIYEVDDAGEFVLDGDGNQIVTTPYVQGEGNTRVFDPLNYERNYSTIETENLSLATSLQYRFNDNASVWLDVTHSDRLKDTHQFNQTIQNLGGATSAHVVDEEAKTSVSIEGTSRVRIVALENPIDTQTTTLGLNYQQLLLDGTWTLDAMFGYSRSTSSRPTETSRQVIFNSGANEELATIDWLNDNGSPLLSPEYTVAGTFDGSFPSTSIPVQSMQYITRDSEDRNFTYQLDLQGDVEFGPIVGIGMGAKIVDRDRSGRGVRFLLDLNNNVAVDSQGNTILDSAGDTVGIGDISLADVETNFPVDNFLTRVIGGDANGWTFPDTELLYNTFVSGDLLGTINSDALSLQNILDDEDPNVTTFDSTALYLMADYELFDGRLLGDFGVRWVKTESLARGRAGFNFSAYEPEGEVQEDGNGDPILDEDGNPVIEYFNGPRFSIVDEVFGEIEYTNVLPSFNARFMISEEMLLRFSVAKVMSRPNPSRLVPGYAITSREEIDPSATGGNPELDPTEVLQYDLSWEWYFDTTAMVSAALFYKDFKSMTYSQTIDRGFGDSECASADRFPTAEEFALSDGYVVNQQLYRDEICARILEDVATTTLVNGDGGKIVGIETSYQQDFTFLPGWAQYFGTVINYTYADSSATFVNKDSSDEEIAERSQLLDGFPMLKTSKHTFNGTLYWENEGFSARIAYNYRSKYLRNPSNFDGAIWQDDRSTVDFSARYKVNKLLSLNFTATNLTDSYNRQFITILEEEPENGIYSEGNALENDVPEWRTFIADHNGRNFRLGATYKF